MSPAAEAVARIPITKPFFGMEEERAVKEPLATGWVAQGPYTAEFERRFADYMRNEHAVATSSCTTALHLAVAALGLKRGDEVIVPAFTWVATPNVVEYSGATPIFCDVDLRTFNLDTSLLEGLVTERTVGMLPVHMFGLCADMDATMAVARRRGLWVVEDAACAFGARSGDCCAGSFGDAGCFSFHPRKSITTGEGGMLTTGDPGVADLARALRDHGASRSDLSRHEGGDGFLLPHYDHLGYNYRLTDIQAALGCAQLDRADWILSERRRRAERYDELLADLEWLRTPMVPETDVHGYQAYVCLFAPEEPTLENANDLHDRRNRLMAALERKGIATRQGTHAPVLTGYYSNKYGFRAEHFPKAFLAERLSLTLPLYPQMTDDEQDRVVLALRGAEATS